MHWEWRRTYVNPAKTRSSDACISDSSRAEKETAVMVEGDALDTMVVISDPYVSHDRHHFKRRSCWPR